MSQPPLDAGRLRLLREVALRGTIAGAARALGLTASAVSQQLAVLEREAGTPLLDRSSRGAVLTGAGRALAERAAAIAEVLAEARADLDRIAGDVAGQVRLATVASAAATMVSSAVLRLREAHPAVTVRVLTCEPARSLELLLAGDVDLALVDEYDYQPVALPDHLEVVELRTEPLVLVTSRDVRVSRGPVALVDLADADWVMPPDEAACGLAVRAACRAAGFEPRVGWETDDMLLLVRAVAAGHGVAVLPELAVDPSLTDVRVRAVERPALRRRLVLTARPASARRPVVAALSSGLAAAAGHADGRSVSA